MQTLTVIIQISILTVKKKKPNSVQKSTQKNRSLIYTKARIIITKYNELISYAVTEKPNIIAISETCVNSENKHLIVEFATPRYKIFMKYHLYRVGGGVLIYSNNNLSAIKISKVYTHTYDCLY